MPCLSYPSKFMNEYKYTIKDLVQAFKDHGIIVSDQWIRRQETKGNLVIAHSATNFKKFGMNRPSGSVRMFTKQQINDIVEAFLPNGKGYYNYRDEEETQKALQENLEDAIAGGN